MIHHGVLRVKSLREEPPLTYVMTTYRHTSTSNNDNNMYTQCERVKLPDDSCVYIFRHVIITLFSVNLNFRSRALLGKYCML